MCEFSLSRVANLMGWHILLFQDDEHDQHTGFAMAPLVTKGAPIVMSSMTSFPDAASLSAKQKQRSWCR